MLRLCNGLAPLAEGPAPSDRRHALPRRLPLARPVPYQLALLLQMKSGVVQGTLQQRASASLPGLRHVSVDPVTLDFLFLMGGPNAQFDALPPPLTGTAHASVDKGVCYRVAFGAVALVVPEGSQLSCLLDSDLLLPREGRQHASTVERLRALDPAQDLLEYTRCVIALADLDRGLRRSPGLLTALERNAVEEPPDVELLDAGQLNFEPADERPIAPPNGEPPDAELQDVGQSDEEPMGASDEEMEELVEAQDVPEDEPPPKRGRYDPTAGPPTWKTLWHDSQLRPRARSLQLLAVAAEQLRWGCQGGISQRVAALLGKDVSYDPASMPPRQAWGLPTYARRRSGEVLEVPEGQCEAVYHAWCRDHEIATLRVPLETGDVLFVTRPPTVAEYYMYGVRVQVLPGDELVFQIYAELMRWVGGDFDGDKLFVYCLPTGATAQCLAMGLHPLAFRLRAFSMEPSGSLGARLLQAQSARTLPPALVTRALGHLRAAPRARLPSTEPLLAHVLAATLPPTAVPALVARYNPTFPTSFAALQQAVALRHGHAAAARVSLDLCGVYGALPGLLPLADLSCWDDPRDLYHPLACLPLLEEVAEAAAALEPTLEHLEADLRRARWTAHGLGQTKAHGEWSVDAYRAGLGGLVGALGLYAATAPPAAFEGVARHVLALLARPLATDNAAQTALAAVQAALYSAEQPATSQTRLLFQVPKYRAAALFMFGLPPGAGVQGLPVMGLVPGVEAKTTGRGCPARVHGPSKAQEAAVCDGRAAMGAAGKHWAARCMDAIASLMRTAVPRMGPGGRLYVETSTGPEILLGALEAQPLGMAQTLIRLPAARQDVLPKETTLGVGPRATPDEADVRWVRRWLLGHGYHCEEVVDGLRERWRGAESLEIWWLFRLQRAAPSTAWATWTAATTTWFKDAVEVTGPTLLVVERYVGAPCVDPTSSIRVMDLLVPATSFPPLPGTAAASDPALGCNRYPWPSAIVLVPTRPAEPAETYGFEVGPGLPHRVGGGPPCRTPPPASLARLAWPALTLPVVSPSPPVKPPPPHLLELLRRWLELRPLPVKEDGLLCYEDPVASAELLASVGNTASPAPARCACARRTLLLARYGQQLHLRCSQCKQGQCCLDCRTPAGAARLLRLRHHAPTPVPVSQFVAPCATCGQAAAPQMAYVLPPRDRASTSLEHKTRALTFPGGGKRFAQACLACAPTATPKAIANPELAAVLAAAGPGAVELVFFRLAADRLSLGAAACGELEELVRDFAVGEGFPEALVHVVVEATSWWLLVFPGGDDVERLRDRLVEAFLVAPPGWGLTRPQEKGVRAPLLLCPPALTTTGRAHVSLAFAKASHALEALVPLRRVCRLAGVAPGDARFNGDWNGGQGRYAQVLATALAGEEACYEDMLVVARCAALRQRLLWASPEQRFGTWLQLSPGLAGARGLLPLQLALAEGPDVVAMLSPQGPLCAPGYLRTPASPAAVPLRQLDELTTPRAETLTPAMDGELYSQRPHRVLPQTVLARAVAIRARQLLQAPPVYGRARAAAVGLVAASETEWLLVAARELRRGKLPFAAWYDGAWEDLRVPRDDPRLSAVEEFLCPL